MSDEEEESAVPKISGAKLVQTAADIVNETVAHTTVFDTEAESRLPRFETSEVVCGRVIGMGGFCDVLEIKSFDLEYGKRKAPPRWRSNRSQGRARSEHSEETSEISEAEAREDIAWNCVEKGKPRYCMKLLPAHGDDRRKRKASFVKGIVDLALETKFLTILNHPNIVKLVGLSEVGPYEDGYFLILQMLPETLEKRRKKWAVTDGQCRGVTGALTGGKKKKVGFIQERLHVALDIASAMHYMHGMNIIYRDLKPGNIGFDAMGRVKIFDMGLAKELRDDEKDENGRYKMTALTGSVRYMAPEIGRREPYNLSADVFSFGLLLWYIMALEPPFTPLNSQAIMKKVFRDGKRPLTLVEWSDGLKSLMKKCWKEKPTSRPNFERVKGLILKELSVVGSPK